MELDLTGRIISIVLLILASGYFSMAEISLAASPKVKLHQALENGDKRAQQVLDLQVKAGAVLFCNPDRPERDRNSRRYHRRDRVLAVLRNVFPPVSLAGTFFVSRILLLVLYDHDDLCFVRRPDS